MKVNCVLFASLLIGVCDLLAGVRAYSDYNAELDARDNVDYLSTRDFAYDHQDLDAREPAAIEVPFQPSIRDFLKEAAVMYRRGFFDGKDRKVLLGTFNFVIAPPVTQSPTTYADVLKVYEGDTGATIKKNISNWALNKYGVKLPPFTLKFGLHAKGKDRATVLEDDVKFVVPSVGDTNLIVLWAADKLK